MTGAVGEEITSRITDTLVYTDPIAVSESIDLVFEYKRWLAEVQRLKVWSKKPEMRPLSLRASRSAWEHYYENKVKTKTKKFKEFTKIVQDFVALMARRYPYIQYLVDSPIANPAILSVIALPPDLTWGNPPFIHSWSWVNTAFLPPRRNGVLVAGTLQKFFMRNAIPVMIMQGLRRLANAVPIMYRFYESTYSKYTAKGYPHGRAKKIAIRDTIRVYLGNAWLIATLDALEKQVIKPDQVELPYPLAKDPEYLHQLIDPEKTLEPHRGEKYRKYTWRTLLRLLENNKNNK